MNFSTEPNNARIVFTLTASHECNVDIERTARKMMLSMHIINFSITLGWLKLEAPTL